MESLFFSEGFDDIQACEPGKAWGLLLSRLIFLFLKNPGGQGIG